MSTRSNPKSTKTKKKNIIIIFSIHWPSELVLQVSVKRAFNDSLTFCPISNPSIHSSQICILRLIKAIVTQHNSDITLCDNVAGRGGSATPQKFFREPFAMKR